jgi:hypothetical protein
MVKRKSIAKRSPLQKQKQTQIVNINLAKPKRKGKRKGKTERKSLVRGVNPVYIRQPEFIPPAFNYPAQTSLIPPPLAPRSAFPSQLGSAVGEALVNVPANSLLAGLTVAPRLATAATTATGSILLSAINASPNIITGIGSAIRQSFTLPPRERIVIQPPEEEVEVPRVERVNPFQRYADEEVQRLLNRDLDLLPRQREGEDIATDVEEEAVVEAPLARRRQPLASAPPAPETVFAEPLPVVDEFFDLPEEEEEPPEVLPYTAPQIEDLRKQTALATSLDPSQFPLLGTPFVEPSAPSLEVPVVETDEPLTERLAVPSLIDSPPIEPIGFGKPVTQGFFGEVKPPAVEAAKKGRPRGSTNKPKEVPTASLLSFFPLVQNVEPPSIPFQTAVREEGGLKVSPTLSELGGAAVRQPKGEPPKSELERVRPEEVKEAEAIPFSSFGN